MRYRRFGRTELQIPVLSCGGMRYQHSWKDDEADGITEENQRNLEATIDRAIGLGINHIETARGYGTSEVQLARVFPNYKREDLIIQTKVAPYASVEEFNSTFDRSMRNLKLDYVDLFALHGINNDELLEWSLRPGGCLDAAYELKRQGRVRHIGFSTHGPTDVIVRAVESGRFDYVNLHWYYINQWNRPAIEAATRHDTGVFIISPSDKGGMLYNPPAKLAELCRPLSPMVFNDLFCLSCPEVHTLSLGASRPEDFDEHMKAVEQLDDAERVIAPVIERLDAEMRRVVGSEWLDTYLEGLPDWRDTPGGIHIGVILWLRNLVRAWDMVEYGRMRYNLLGNGGHWFAGEQAKNLDEHDLTECLARSPHRGIIPGILAETHAMLGGAEVKRLSES